MGPNTAWDLKTNSRGTQTDLVTDRNIQECLMELKSTPEFQGLAYRVGQTLNGEVTLTVTRTDAAGLLGVPLDPVTIIVTAGGLCYLSALFAPVEVTDLKPNGHFALRLFRNILRKLNGRSGFGFCPGFQESDFPESFQFGKNGFECIRHPFTRVQAKGCPVFFQQRKPRPGGQELGSELCSRCLQTGMGVCELLKESGSDGEVPGLVKTLTKVGRRSPSVECAKTSASKSNGTLPSSKTASTVMDKTAPPASDGHNSDHKTSPAEGKYGGSTSSVCASPPPTSSPMMPPSSASVSPGSHQRQPNPVPAALIKPFRTVAPSARDTTDPTAGGFGQGDTVTVIQGIDPSENTNAPLIMRLKLGRSVSSEASHDSPDPPPLMAEVSSSPVSPRQLCIDEDADPDTLEPAVDGEPDSKRMCIRCSSCSESYSSSTELENHVQHSHPGSSAAADASQTGEAGVSSGMQGGASDPQTSQSSQQGPEHGPRVRGKTCPVCKQQFITKEDLEVHLRERHRTRLHACRYCGQKFALRSNLSTHLLSHMGSAHLKCQECGAKFSKKKKYAEHIREHMGSLPFFCKICTKLFSREKTYEEHMERHKTRRAMKTLVGTEKTTQGIMDRARRCLEDRVQMGLPVSVGAGGPPPQATSSVTVESGGSPVTSADQSQSTVCDQPSSESKQALCASSNLDLLSAVSLAQAELDQAFSSVPSTAAASPSENTAAEGSARDANVQIMEVNSPVSGRELQPDGQTKQSVDTTERNNELVGDLSPAAPGVNTGEAVKAESKTEEGGTDGKPVQSSTLLQRLSAPPVSSLTAPSSNASSSTSSSMATSPVRSHRSSPESSHTDGQSEESRHAPSNAKDDVLREIQEREKKLLQKEQELKEREETMAKKNLLLFQQLLLTHLSQQQHPPGPGQGQPTGAAGVAKGERMPGVMPLLGVLRGMGPVNPGAMFRPRPPGTMPAGLRPPLQPTHRFPVANILMPAGAQQGPRPIAPADPSAARLQRPVAPGSEKRRPQAETTTPKRRRPMTTPTPPPPDAPLQNPNTVSSASGPPSSSAQKGKSPSKSNTAPGGLPLFGGKSLLQEIMKLESKMPESAKQFLPSTKKQTGTQRRLQTAAHPANIPSTVLTGMEAGGSSNSKTKRGQSQAQPSVDFGLRGDRTGQARCSGGLVLGKEKVQGSPMTLVPIGEMKRLLGMAMPAGKSSAITVPSSNAESTASSPSPVTPQASQASTRASAAQTASVSLTTLSLPPSTTALSPPAQSSRPPSQSGVSTTPPVPAGSPSNARQPRASPVPTAAASKGNMGAPPPLFLPNAAGGLPVPMTVPSTEEMAPMDLSKSSSRSPAAESSHGEKSADKRGTAPMNLSSSPQSVLLRQYLQDPNMQTGSLQAGTGERRVSGSPHNTMRSPLASPTGPIPQQAARPQSVTPVHQHPVGLLPQQAPSSIPLIPVSLHPAGLQAPPVAPQMPLSPRGPMSPPQIPVQMPVRGPPQGPVSSQASLPPQRPMLPPNSAPLHVIRTDRMMSPRVILSRIDAVMAANMGAGEQGMPRQRFASVPAPGMVPVHRLMAPLQMVSPPGIRPPPEGASPQRMMSPPHVLSPQSHATPATPPNFLIPTAQPDSQAQPDARDKTEPQNRNKPSAAPLGGFTWHRPAAVDPVYGPQDQGPGDKQNSEAAPALPVQSEEPEPAVDSQRPDVQEPPLNEARDAWQEQFRQTLKKQRHHREQMQRQHQHFLQNHQTQQQEVSAGAKPPAKRGRPRKKHVEATIAEITNEGHLMIPFSPSGLAASIVEEPSRVDTGSGPDGLLDMPVLSQERPPRRPRKRQARKRKQTSRVDVEAMEMENGGEEFLVENEEEMQADPLEPDTLNCDGCGKVFCSEADILQHECGGE